MAGDIQFEEEQQYQRPVYRQTEKKSFLVQLVLATGIVSDDKGAQYVLLGIAILSAVIAIALPLIFLP